MTTLTKQAEYDINIWTVDNVVYLTFYPLEYGEDGLATTNTSEFYSLEIPGDARGPLYRNALTYLENLVNYDFEQCPEIYLQPGWTMEDDLDWWDTEKALVHPPKLIADFVDSLPRKGALHRFLTGE